MCLARDQSEQTWTWFGGGPGAPTPAIMLNHSSPVPQWRGIGERKRGVREVSGLPAESAWPLSPKDLDSFTLGCYGYMPAQDLHWLAEEVLNEFCFPCSKDSSLQIVWPDKLIKTFHFLYFTDSVQRISSCGCCRFSCICVLVFVFFLYVQAYWH